MRGSIAAQACPRSLAHPARITQPRKLHHLPRCAGAASVGAAQQQQPLVAAGAVAEQPAAEPPRVAEPPPQRQAALLAKFRAHEGSSVTALTVLLDQSGSKRVVTASMDKTLAVWDLEGGGLDGPALSCSRVEVPGGPAFSLHRGIRTKVTDANVKPREPVLFCGLASKEIVALRPDSNTFSEQMHMNGHCGWVRCLASSGKYLFSCGCNILHQWDQAYAVPKEVRSTRLFTGDILALATTPKAVFTAGADGSLRAWALGKLGDLTEAAVREKAHDGRITALAVSGSLLFSAGYDGHIKAWDVSTLKLVMEAKAAHSGERVRALVIGPPPSSSSSTVATPAGSTATSRSSSNSSSPPPLPPPSAAAGDAAAAAAAAATPAAAGAADAAAPPAAVQAAAAEVSSSELPPPPAPADALQPEQSGRAAAPVVEAERTAETAASAAAAVDDDLSCFDLTPSPPPPPAAGAAAAAAEGDSGTAAGAPAPPAPRPPSPSVGAVLYSGGDDGLVRRWDVRLLVPAGEPLQVHTAGAAPAAIKALAVGETELLVAGDADGEVAAWLV